jgi:hypothetical protein
MYEPTEPDWMQCAIDQMEYELREWDVQCFRCRRKAKGTQRELEAANWKLAKREECPVCVGFDQGVIATMELVEKKMSARA